MRSKLRAIAVCILLLPLDLIAGFALLTVGLAEFLKRGLKPATTNTTDGSVKPVVAGFSPRSAATVIVVNWDGKHLLAESLPPLIEAINYDGGVHEIVVVDNGSTDGSIEFVQQNFPDVRILALDQNYGFTGGNNRGVAAARTDIVVLLNNDMIVDRGFLRPLLAGFSDPSVFAVTSQIFFADGGKRREETGKTRARFEKGFFYLWHDEIHPSDNEREFVPVFWAGGGSCALDRNKYLALGGLDPLYRPLYVEDTDLSYQAWKRGWKCMLAPASRVVHKHRSTSRRKFGDRFVDMTTRKNQYLFLWKNVSAFSMIVEHVLNLPRIHARAFAEYGARFEIQAYLGAIRQLPEALRKRLANIPHYVLSDQDVLAQSQK